MGLEARNVSFRYGRRQDWVLENVELRLERGERLALLAPSGRGKTTLAMVLAGYLAPTRGEVLLDGAPLSKRGVCPVQLICQHPEHAVNPRWRLRKVLEELARNVPAEEDAAARPSSDKETDLPAAATRMKMTTTMKIWMMTRPMSRSSRKPQRSCALTAVLLCILHTASSSSGCGKSMRQNHPSSHASL